ncbi:hypothetical protein L6164_014030 [Bauhinia variegata]|uniref:Uncharacterized protein n=1 Tax=Bauhinia variegata TaxID=167791 RepID=A0ACB9NGB7_BAUVA|nr:hypothetical protein L6164_014030 [Bauhinia variegata]
MLKRVQTIAPSHLISRHLSSENLLSLVKICSSVKSLRQIHAQMLVNYIRKPNHLLAKIIDLKDFAYASLFFSQIPEPNDYAFNIMIRALTTTWHEYSLALQFYYQMKLLGLRPNKFSYPFLFISCANLLEIDHGRAGHSSVVKLGLSSDGHTSHSLITMYARCRELGYARKVFDEIIEKDLVSWNSLLSGYSKMGYAREAVELFWELKDAGFEPDEMTLVSVLGACGELGDLNLGKWVEEFVVEKHMTLNSYLGSALISMYSRCGELTSARRIFDSMTTKDVITWNAVITGYAQNGMADEAIMLYHRIYEVLDLLYEELKREGYVPRIGE